MTGDSEYIRQNVTMHKEPIRKLPSSCGCLRRASAVVRFLTESQRIHPAKHAAQPLLLARPRRQSRFPGRLTIQPIIRAVLPVLLYAAASRTAQETPTTAPKPINTDLALYDTIAGDLAPFVPAGSRPYLVAGDIYVAAGKTVTIEPGAIFLFKNFTGLQVQGRLSAKATNDRPLIFTSENDRQYNRHDSPDAAPYDWNGVHIHKEGIGTEMEHCMIQYAVDGIVSDTRFIRLSSCILKNNGRTNLSIEGIEHEVGNEPYEYTLTVKDAKLDGVALSVLSDPLALRRSITRYTGIALAAGGAVVGIIFSSNYRDAARKLDRLSSRDPVNLATHSSADWERSFEEKKTYAAATAAGWGCTALGTICLLWSFSF